MGNSVYDAGYSEPGADHQNGSDGDDRWVGKAVKCFVGTDHAAEYANHQGSEGNDIVAPTSP